MTSLPPPTSEPYEKWTTVKSSLRKRILERALVLGAYTQVTLLFGGSVWSLYGEFSFSAVAFLILVGLFIDSLRKYGISGLRYNAPLGFTFYRYQGTLVVLSALVNAAVYIRLLY